MNPKPEISPIRKLLDSYYDGTATPIQIDELSRLLASTPSLPPELEIERDIFNAIAGIASDSIPVPPELSIRLENSINTRHKKHHRHILWVRATSIVAAIAVVCSVGLKTFNPHNTPAPTFGVPVEMLSQRPTDNPIIASIEPTDVPATLKQAPVKRTKPGSKTRKSNATTYRDESKIIWVTDTIEATYYAEQSLQLLAMNIIHAEIACEHTSQKISEINTTLNEILR